jgi:hypothetical protein
MESVTACYQEKFTLIACVAATPDSRGRPVLLCLRCSKTVWSRKLQACLVPPTIDPFLTPMGFRDGCVTRLAVFKLTAEELPWGAGYMVRTVKYG